MTIRFESEARDFASGLAAGLLGLAPRRKASRAWLDGWREGQVGSLEPLNDLLDDLLDDYQPERSAS